VTGYVGTQETILAIERGEAHGRCVFSYSALKIPKPDWLRDKKINVLVLTALERSPDFPGVPAVLDVVTKQDDRQLLELFFSIEITPLSAVSAVSSAVCWRAGGRGMQPVGRHCRNICVPTSRVLVR
jgi:hypothetical protein